ncbi:MAG: TlpA family protein disulfide reductase, partial [Luteimonas sp.]|nr:TlpA family protein disulfide reductase [Luteimonas sp.]
MKLRHLVTLCLLATVLVACKRPADDAQAPSPSPDAAQQQAPVADATAAPATSAPTPEATGKPEMPTLRTTTVDGKPYDLAEHRGNWVVVNFWATWCAPCLKEMPELSALDAMRQHVEVIGLAYEDIDPKELRAFLEKHPVVYPVAIVDVYNPPADFATPRGLPMTYLIAPDGKVAKQFLGPVTAQDI